MVDKAELASKLANVMDAVSVCEGLIYAKANGEVIIGQTLTELDHSAIAKDVADMLKFKISAAGKGDLTDISVGMNDGAIIAVQNSEDLVIGILGADGKSSVGLLNRQLKNLMK